MLPALPDSTPRLPRLLWRLALVSVLALIAVARDARALGVELEAPRAHARYLWVDARLSDLFPDPVEHSLERGMPATLQVHAELWRHRTLWFDRMERAFDASVRIRYEVWKDAFRIERPGSAPLTLSTLDSVRVLLERPIAMPIGPLVQLREDGRYFVVVTATLAPLSVADVQEVEGWLSGEVESKRHSGFGVFTELPQSLFDTVRNFTGFGDRHARAQSLTFEASELVASP